MAFALGIHHWVAASGVSKACLQDRLHVSLGCRHLSSLLTCFIGHSMSFPKRSKKNKATKNSYGAPPKPFFVFFGSLTLVHLGHGPSGFNGCQFLLGTCWVWATEEWGVKHMVTVCQLDRLHVLLGTQFTEDELPSARECSSCCCCCCCSSSSSCSCCCCCRCCCCCWCCLILLSRLLWSSGHLELCREMAMRRSRVWMSFGYFLMSYLDTFRPQTINLCFPIMPII